MQVVGGWGRFMGVGSCPHFLLWIHGGSGLKVENIEDVMILITEQAEEKISD